MLGLSPATVCADAEALRAGGFAYFAVDFFYEPQAMLADIYLILMSISFVCGICVVTANTIVQVCSVSAPLHRTNSSVPSFSSSCCTMSVIHACVRMSGAAAIVSRERRERRKPACRWWQAN